MKDLLFLLVVFLVLAPGCFSGSADVNIGVTFPELGQGVMAGGVTEISAILQTRLTKGRKLTDGDLSGAGGVAYFEVSEDWRYRSSFRTEWLRAEEQNDYIVKVKTTGLKPATRYYYRVCYGPDKDRIRKGPTCSFKTLGGKTQSMATRFVVVTGMNYGKFHKAYNGPDKHAGYPALAAIAKMEPDFFIGTGDNVYYDSPKDDIITDKEQLRRKYHEQFIQQRFIDLFAQVPTYWEKDDHDYRFNDCDNTSKRKPLPATGREIFREQFPVVDPKDSQAVTYGTYRVSRELQIWLVEGRDYRSSNSMPDGPEKSIWGHKQKQWFKRTLLESDAVFKILISPTPMVGPDDNYKRDNHTNPRGFRSEGEEFFQWLKRNGFGQKNFYIVCGDRHWQYHSIHPLGFEEFSCGALVDANSRVGRLPGDAKSTDPKALVRQPYCMRKPSGGFLLVSIIPEQYRQKAQMKFEFFDENGKILYTHNKNQK